MRFVLLILFVNIFVCLFQLVFNLHHQHYQFILLFFLSSVNAVMLLCS